MSGTDTHVSTYSEGLQEALAAVEQMTVGQLYDQLDALEGREHLPKLFFKATMVAAIRKEVVRQVRRDFLNSASPDYKTMRRILS